MQGNYELIIVALFAVGSIIVKIVTALKEQAEKKEIKRRRELQDMENLRTGGRASTEVQPQAGSQQTARAALEEMAAKRRAQIEELRRRRAAAAGQGSPAPVRTAPQMDREERSVSVRRTPASVTSRPEPEDPRATPRVQPRPAGRSSVEVQKQRERQRAIEAQRAREAAERAQRTREVKQRDSRRERANAVAEAKTRAAGEAIESRAAAVRGISAPEAVAATPAKARPVRGKDFVLNRGNLRQAIVLQEVLAPPLSLRQ